MTRDTLTLPLFAGELLPTSPWTSMPSLPAHWPPKMREGFIWYCQNGNQELQDMCAASLWKSDGFTYDEAHDLVRAIRAQPVTLLHETPACAHFARPMATAEGAAA